MTAHPPTRTWAERDAQPRIEFERWANAAPYERNTTRWPLDAAVPWPGQYHDLAVQLAWEAWQAARGSR